MKAFWLILISFIFKFSIISYGSPINAIFFGDAPYFLPEGYGMVDKLVSQIQNRQPTFAAHVGDILGGSCKTGRILKVRSIFNQFKVPFLYTPGDNEWTDCHRKRSGSFDPMERLNLIRTHFFKKKLYFGQASLNVQSQSTVMRSHNEFIENLTWKIKDVRFTTMHIVGSNNNYDRDQVEFSKRNTANLEWLRHSFKTASANNAKALVLIFHANIFYKKSTIGKDGKGQPTIIQNVRPGFKDIIDELKILVPKFGKPVLAIHGDSHTFRFDNPLEVMTPYGMEFRHPNFFRAEVFGAPDVRGIHVKIDTDQATPFSVTPLPHIKWTYPTDN